MQRSLNILVLGTVMFVAQAIANEPDASGPLAGHFASSYGFELDVPRGHEAGPSAAVGDHGVIISIDGPATNAQGSVEFYAAFNVLFWKNTDEAVEAHVDWLRERAVQNVVTVLSKRRRTIRGMEGVQVAVKYRERDAGREMISDTIIILRSRAGADRLGDVPDFHYSFGLVATEGEYAHSRRMFEGVLATLRFSKPDE